MRFGNRKTFSGAGTLAAAAVNTRHILAGLVVTASADATFTVGAKAGVPVIIPASEFGWVESEDNTDLTIATSAGTIAGVALLQTETF